MVFLIFCLMFHGTYKILFLLLEKYKKKISTYFFIYLSLHYYLFSREIISGNG